MDPLYIKLEAQADELRKTALAIEKERPALLHLAMRALDLSRDFELVAAELSRSEARL